MRYRSLWISMLGAAWALPTLAQDAARGRQLFEQCAACHKVQAESDTDGPTLVGVLGRRSGTLPDFRYSRAMTRAALTWDERQLDAYLADPQAVVAGTRMAFPGLPDKPDRLDLIAYLKTLR
jgi:cytochrome c